ncbi:MAG: acyltransferase family protein [Flavisolibacter sp.]
MFSTATFKTESISRPVRSLTTPAIRVTSIDVYRGFVMLLMMAEVLSFNQISQSLPASNFWSFLAFNQDHVPWVGCSLHDTIQPSFSFLVGVAVPYSIASRMAKGARFSDLFRHTLFRSIILVLLGIFLRSMSSKQTYFTFEDTLTQIGLGYTFLFLLAFCSRRVQIISLIGILVLYWAAFALYPLPSANFDYSAAGVSPGWENNLSGFAAHWNKNTNLAWAFDKWFLNLFPREHVFTNNSGGYATLSFIPTLATMILGLLAGSKLKSEGTVTNKLRWFLKWGSILIIAGCLLQITGINPIVKRIWTPAWVLFSGGLCFYFLSFFYWVVDILNYKKWSFPLMVIGMNSIAAYLIAHTLPGFINSSLSIHLGHDYALIFGKIYEPLVKGILLLLIEFFILYWMYKRKIFIKI